MKSQRFWEVIKSLVPDYKPRVLLTDLEHASATAFGMVIVESCSFAALMTQK